MSAPAEPPSLDQLTHLMEELVPFNRFLGIRADAVEVGRCVLRMPWRDELTGDPYRPAVHGGVLSTLADVAGGLACFTALPDRRHRLSTVDMRIDFLRPAHGTDLICEATVVRMGNRVGVARMELFAADSGADREPIATGQAVYNVTAGPASQDHTG